MKDKMSLTMKERIDCLERKCQVRSQTHTVFSPDNMNREMIK